MVLAGKTQAAVSSHFQVHVNTVKNWVKRFRTTGDLRPTPATPPAIGWWEELRQEVQAHPDRFQSEHAKQFGVVQSTVSKALKQLGLTRKNKTTTYLEQNETDKQAFLARIQESPAATQVYLDESGISPQLARDYGWAPIGEPITFKRLGHRTPNLNIIAALCDGEIKAPVVYEGAMNTALFNTYLREHLLPALPPGKILHLDNASFHKSAETRQLIAEHGSQLDFLPTYSPELNPIEHTWAALKRYVKRFRADFNSLRDTLEFIFQSIPLFQGG
jgi:transposase